MADNTAKKLPAHKDKTKHFKPGVSPNPMGRPKGSRNKLGEAFLADLYESWKEKGSETLEAVRVDKPDVYVKVIASILPKELNVNHDVLDGLTMEELDQYADILQSIANGTGEDKINTQGGKQKTRTIN